MKLTIHGTILSMTNNLGEPCSSVVVEIGDMMAYDVLSELYKAGYMIAPQATCACGAAMRTMDDVEKAILRHEGTYHHFKQIKKGHGRKRK